QLRHPGIVTVHEVQTLEGLPCIVSDFIEGVSLKDLLEVRRLTFREAAELVAQVAEAVDYAHTMKLVHRDLKPANILLEYPRRPHRATLARGGAPPPPAAPPPPGGGGGGGPPPPAGGGGGGGGGGAPSPPRPGGGGGGGGGGRGWASRW